MLLDGLGKNVFFFIAIILFIFIIMLYRILKHKGGHYRNKLFDSLVKNSETIYLLCDHNKRDIIYITKSKKR